MKAVWEDLVTFHKHWATEEAMEGISLCSRAVSPEVCQMSELQRRTKNNIQNSLGYWEYPSDFAASHATSWTENDDLWIQCHYQYNTESNSSFTAIISQD